MRTAVALRTPTSEDLGNDKDVGRGAGQRRDGNLPEVEEEDKVIDRIVSVQREIAGLEDEAERVAEEAIELAGEVSF